MAKYSHTSQISHSCSNLDLDQISSNEIERKTKCFNHLLGESLIPTKTELSNNVRVLSLNVTWNWSRLAQTVTGIFSSGWVVVKISRQTADLVPDRPRSSSRSIGRLFLLRRRMTAVPFLHIWNRWRVGVTVVRNGPHVGACEPGFTAGLTQLDYVASWEDRRAKRADSFIRHFSSPLVTLGIRPAVTPPHSAWVANDGTTCFQGSVRSVGYFWPQESREWTAIPVCWWHFLGWCYWKYFCLFNSL